MTQNKKEFKGLSKKTRLLLNQDEGLDSEFKVNGKNLKGEDFAAFANSNHGGTILIGVQETKDVNGRQKGEVVGCNVGDQEKLSLVSKAQQCYPPVEIEIFVENINDKPIYRIEIPSGEAKPYCSSGGTYKIRKDGQSVSLLPQNLLRIYLAEESGKFLQNFKESTIELRDELQHQNLILMGELQRTAFETESNISDVIDRVEYSFGDLASNIETTEKEISEYLESIKDDTDEIGYENSNTLYDMQTSIDELFWNVSKLNRKLSAILNHHGIEEPEKIELRQLMKTMLSSLKSIHKEQKIKFTDEEIKELFEKNCSMDGRIANFFNEKDYIKWYEEL